MYENREARICVKGEITGLCCTNFKVFHMKFDLIHIFHWTVNKA
jgi:hypothetical protein